MAITDSDLCNTS